MLDTVLDPEGTAGNKTKSGHFSGGDKLETRARNGVGGERGGGRGGKEGAKEERRKGGRGEGGRKEGRREREREMRVS